MNTTREDLALLRDYGWGRTVLDLEAKAAFERVAAELERLERETAETTEAYEAQADFGGKQLGELARLRDGLRRLEEAGNALSSVATEWARKSNVAADGAMHAQLASALAMWEEARDV